MSKGLVLISRSDSKSQLVITKSKKKQPKSILYP
jgi:hypothetical protein